MPCPAVSVIIPLYNAEKYIGECLESVLVQTFQSFEVIVVDDCSTDSSYKVVESYIPKFDGRLRLAKTEVNSGGGGEPRNIGLKLASGEYIQCLDADDMLTKTALEELYTLAKEYDADVVYCEKYYRTDADGSNMRINTWQKGELVKIPTFETEDLAQRTDKILQTYFLTESFLKFVRRKLIIDNEIFFPCIKVSEDTIWTYVLLFYAKRFLRVPNIVHVYRASNNSVMREERTPQQKINFWMEPVLLGLKNFDEFMSKHKFFKTNPSSQYALLKKFVDGKFNRTVDLTREFTEDVIYLTIKNKFSERLGNYDVIIPTLCTLLYNEKKFHKDDNKIIREFALYLTARLDIKMIPKDGDGDFQIISVSDDKAKVTKPAWFQKGGIGYMITSYVGKLEIVTKATADGQIQLNFRGMDVRDPNDNSKRIPQWIDYTKFAVNGKMIFDKFTPAWHDAPYRHDMGIKANEEIVLQIEWFPHETITNLYSRLLNKEKRSIMFKPQLKSRSNFTSEGTNLFKNTDETMLINSFKFPPPLCLPCPAVSVIIPLYNAEKYIGECLDSVLHQSFQSFEVIVVDDCSTDSSYKVVESYIPKFDGRLRLAKTEVNSGGGSEPRNIGLNLAGGEYVYFVDADDFILLTTLETLYNAAKEYDAEVVYTGAYFRLDSPKNPVFYRDGEGKKLLKDGLKDESDLRINDQKGNLNRLFLGVAEGNFSNPWSKFIRRNFLLKNEIFFQKIPIGEDFIWVIKIYCHAKRFLRIPNPLYFYRCYNNASVTKQKKEPSQQISYWISNFVEFVKSLRALENRNKILSDNPAYCFAALKWHFRYCLNRTDYARNELSDEAIYEALCREFINGTSDLTAPFFFSCIDYERKLIDYHLKTIKKLEKKVADLKSLNRIPAVSVIIPMYNAEKYIVECLDSLLAQTFQNFEVIVVDDCSTDNSVAIVKSYAPKFNGRLILAKMETNSGGCALPRNKGLRLSSGEYIQCLDADDILTKTALEELYTLAKTYESDVVYCERYYCMNNDGTNIQIENMQKGVLVKIPTLESEEISNRIEGIFQGRFWVTAWVKFVQRKLIFENEIFFPYVAPGEDDIWTYTLVFYAKRFLRVPNIVYNHRLSNNSVMRTERTSLQEINFRLNPTLFGLNHFDRLMSKHEFFKANPSSRYALLKKFVSGSFYWTVKYGKEFTEDVIYSTIKDEFSERLGEYDVLIPALCTALYEEKKAYSDVKKNYDDVIKANKDNIQISRDFAPYVTARLDIKLTFKVDGGDFQIISISDDKARIGKPEWFNKGGIGYVIQSYAGKLEIVFKATVDGRISFAFRGVDFRDPNDKSKRIPCWIDYTKLVVNEQIVLDKLTPVWHDKPYRYGLEIKTGEEITVQFEWLPHRSDT